METNVLIALIVVVLLVVGVNGILFLLMRRGETNRHIRLWQDAASRARNPWESEDRQLEELSRLVKDLNEEGDPTADSPDGSETGT